MSHEQMHPVGDDPAWSESYYFNFIDPQSKLGMFTRMGFRPGSGWADALHVIYLEGKRVAFTYGRRDIGSDLTAYDGDLGAGDLTITCIEPHERWRLDYEGPAQDIPDAAFLLERSKLRPDGWFTPATLTTRLEFACTTPPHYSGMGEIGGATRGHFEQSGHVTGTIGIGDETWTVDGYGIRDKSWGPRDWGAGSQGSGGMAAAGGDGPRAFVNWFSMNFGPDVAIGGSCFLHPDGTMRGEGWLQRGDESTVLEDVEIQTQYASDSILHESLVLRGKAAGEPVEIAGNVLSVCPTKIPTPAGAIFVNEGLAEFRWGNQTGYGIAEHWHGVSRGG